MPQASDESRQQMAQYFGDDGTDLVAPLEFLRSQGWTDPVGWLRYKEGRPRAEITPKEWHCVEFLCDEWDFGFDTRDQWDSEK